MDQKLGRWVNNNLSEYHIPTNADIGDLEAFWVDEEPITPAKLLRI